MEDKLYKALRISKTEMCVFTSDGMYSNTSERTINEVIEYLQELVNGGLEVYEVTFAVVIPEGSNPEIVLGIE